MILVDINAAVAKHHITTLLFFDYLCFVLSGLNLPEWQLNSLKKELNLQSL